MKKEEIQTTGNTSKSVWQSKAIHIAGCSIVKESLIRSAIDEELDFIVVSGRATDVKGIIVFTSHPGNLEVDDKYCDMVKSILQEGDIDIDPSVVMKRILDVDGLIISEEQALSFEIIDDGETDDKFCIIGTNDIDKDGDADVVVVAFLVGVADPTVLRDIITEDELTDFIAIRYGDIDFSE